MRNLPEMREFCRREVQALERMIALLDYTEKRVAEVTFRESVGGVRCMGCVSEDYGRRHVGDVPNRRQSREGPRGASAVRR